MELLKYWQYGGIQKRIIVLYFKAAVKVGGLAEVGKECAKWGRLNFDRQVCRNNG